MPVNTISAVYVNMDNARLMTHLAKMKSVFAEAQHVINGLQKNQTCSAQSLEKNFIKSDLCEKTFSLIQHVNRFQESLNDLDETLKDYKVINRNHEELTEKLVQKVVETTKNELRKIIPQPEENGKPKKQIVSHEKQVLIIDDIEKKDIENNKSFSSALKENLSDKLQKIPITKSTISREGKAILVFPTPESCAKAKESLKTVYNVKNSDRKPTIIQPRLKIHNLDPKLIQYDKNELRNKIVSKNEALENATDDEFMITFIDKKQYFAIAKVSPDVHKKLTNNGRVYIELWSNRVSDHFNPVQCFQCQSFNHISTSSVCIVKDKPQELTCLYCSKNHKSSQCPSKKDRNAHKCANCHRSDISSIKNGASTHTSASKMCPIYIKEVERLKKFTCYDQLLFSNSKNSLKPI